MDKPRAPAPPGPDSPEFDQRRAEGVSLYRQYQGFLADAASELQRALDSIDANVRRGTIAPEQAQSAELQARQSYDARLQEIEGGPTRSLVESEYEAQRDAARSAYDQRYGHVLGQTYELREAPSYGEPGYYRLYTSGRGEQMEEFVGREDPRASLPQFEFASRLLESCAEAPDFQLERAHALLRILQPHQRGEALGDLIGHGAGKQRVVDQESRHGRIEALRCRRSAALSLGQALAAQLHTTPQLHTKTHPLRVLQ